MDRSSAIVKVIVRLRPVSLLLLYSSQWNEMEEISRAEQCRHSAPATVIIYSRKHCAFDTAVSINPVKANLKSEHQSLLQNTGQIMELKKLHYAYFWTEVSRRLRLESNESMRDVEASWTYGILRSKSEVQGFGGFGSACRRKMVQVGYNACLQENAGPDDLQRGSVQCLPLKCTLEIWVKESLLSLK